MNKKTYPNPTTPHHLMRRPQAISFGEKGLVQDPSSTITLTLTITFFVSRKSRKSQKLYSAVGSFKNGGLLRNP
jgi:hypothetical protein